MLVITATKDLRYRVEYRLDGVLVYTGEFNSDQENIAMLAIKDKMRLLMGLQKGKTFTVKTGREL